MFVCDNNLDCWLVPMWVLSLAGLLFKYIMNNKYVTKDILLCVLGFDITHKNNGFR